MKKKIFPGLLLMAQLLNAQDYRQTVKGKVIDKESHSPVAYAVVILRNSTFKENTITNEEGIYQISHVPVGRITLEVRSAGYQSIKLSNLEVTMGKELIVDIEMTERVVEIDQVSIKAFNNKEKPINSFAPVSAQMFTIEETQRYAGSQNDVSRMAMNFAGVKMSAETTNEIVIRGNSPISVLFRLDGVDIPNPGHFGDGSTTGGPMSMLNNNVLSNSDFLTGAFPAEYGNTLSGVFDLRMRNGNNRNHEFIVQTGLMGIEAGVEGPISKKNNSSYLINYRYSTVGILDLLGLSLMGTAKTNYQDISFKLNFPSTKIGNITFFGLGGKSFMKMYDSERDTTKEREQMAYESDYEIDILNDNYSGAVGLSHSCIFGNSAYSKLILSATTIANYNSWDSLSIADREPVLEYFSDFKRIKYKAEFFINKKFNGRNTIKTGISAEIRKFDLLDSMYVGSIHAYRKLRDFDGDDIFSRIFIQYRHDFSDHLQITIGFNNLLQFSTHNLSPEPRAGLKWEFLPGHSVNFGYGLHSMSIPVEIANQEILQDDGSYIKPNTELDFIKSHHLVAGYKTKLFQNIRFKSELYYQYIFNSAVGINTGSYSLLNHGSYTTIDVPALQNGGRGYNYGMEFTVEKFMDHGTYFLSNLSLYESKYRGSDGVLRNTAFNGNYVYNILGGKEFGIGNQNGDFIKKLTVDGKLNWAGGQRYSPIDLEASEKAGTTVFDDTNAYSKQLPAYFRIDLRVGFKWTGKRSSQELAIDIRNITNRENPFTIKYDTETGDLKTLGFGLTPDLYYRITF